MEHKLTVFTDFQCPFCYIGEGVIDGLRRDIVLVEDYVGFEIHPDIPAQGVDTVPYLESLGYRNARDIIKAIRGRIEQLGLKVGPMVRKYNTHLALLLIAYATEQRKAREYVQAVNRANFEDNANISDHTVLGELLKSVGLPGSLKQIKGLQDGSYERQFVAQQSVARQLGITGVPTYIVDQRSLITGAQEAAVFRQAFMQTERAIPPIGSSRARPDIGSCQTGRHVCG